MAPTGGCPDGPNTSRGAALSAFKTIAENKVCVVRKAGAQFDSQIPNILDKACQAAQTEPVYINAGQDAGHMMLESLQRDGLPLVFINGDCIGGRTELGHLDKSGWLAEALKPHQYDLVVIGGGSGGLAAAKEAANLGKKVACLDYVQPTPTGTTWGLGGTCVNVGCIPKKLMHQASLLGESIKDARRFGWKIPEGEVHLNWAKLKDAVQDHIGSLNWGYRVQLREKKAVDVTYYNSYGVFTGSHEVTATNKKGKTEKITADRFLVAVGLRPRYPDIPGAKEFCITSDDLFSLPYNPGKTLCIGASYVSLECAGFLHGFGNDVSILVRSIVLRGFDQDMAIRIRNHMTLKGMRFIEGVVKKFERVKEPTDSEPGLIRFHGERTVEGFYEPQPFVEEFNTVVLAIGRDAKTETLGLDKIGVNLSKAGKVIGRNSHEQSASVPNIYAVGDVLDEKPELTPVAIQAGRVLMRRLYTGNMEMTEYDQVPTTVFTPLEYGCCGLSEDEAKKRYGEENVDIYHNVFIPLEFTIPERMENTHCYCKLICLKTEQDRVLGFHILTPNAGEVTQGFAIALKFNAKKADFDRLIGIHPTVAENFTTLTLIKKGDEELKASGC
ncbi:thioredoxin reductase 1 [Aphelenchoides avenae]|nr:thioredoxin reductase 1 [Aphelenchus avenae]